MKLFHFLALEGSYTKAAKLLYISQPALSVQIKKLECQLGIKLIDKVGNKISLNENGKLLFQYTQQIFSLIEEANHVLLNNSDCIMGSINVGGSNTPGTYILPKIIGDFKNLYPDVNINLHITNTDGVAQLISEGKLDFAINGGDLTYKNNIYVEKLAADKMVLAVSPLSSISKKDCIQPSDLADKNFISHESNSQLRDFIINFINDLGISPNITMTFGGTDAIKQAVAANLGISLLPYSAVSLELKLGIIKELHLKDKSWLYPYSLIYNKSKYLSPATQKMLQLVRNRMLDFQKEA
ncbi:MAG: LysR substrate-binding domain-containing protein [Bacillota bacterium]